MMQCPRISWRRVAIICVSASIVLTLVSAFFHGVARSGGRTRLAGIGKWIFCYSTWYRNDTQLSPYADLLDFCLIFVLMLVSTFISAIALSVLVPGYTWIRPHTRGVCPSCGYSLAGLTGSVCPECGRHVVDSDGAGAQTGRGP